MSPNPLQREEFFKLFVSTLSSRQKLSTTHARLKTIMVRPQQEEQQQEEQQQEEPAQTVIVDVTHVLFCLK